MLKNLGFDLAGEYNMKLYKPYLDKYYYLTIRFMIKYYNIWVYEFVFLRSMMTRFQ